MSKRVYQRGDRVEWDQSGKIRHGTVDGTCGGKFEGYVMVIDDGAATSRPIAQNRLRSTKKPPMPAPIAGDVA